MQYEQKRETAIPFWRDERVLRALGQIVFVALVVFVATLIYQNMKAGLARQGISLSYAFLKNLSGFDIAETAFPYSRNSAYWQAFLIGLLNTLLVSVVGIIFSTILGVILGVEIGRAHV